MDEQEKPQETDQPQPTPVEQPTQEDQPKLKSKLPLVLTFLILIVGGTIGAVVLNQKQTPQPTIQINPSPTPTPDPTADWKTYTNSSLGFSFKYPDDYFQFQQDFPNIGVYLAPSAGEGGNGPKFLEEGDVWIDISVGSGANIASVDEYLNLPGQKQPEANALKTSKTIGGSPGFTLHYSFPAVAGNITIYTYETLVLKNEKIYKMVLSAWSSDALQVKEPLFDQILSTFKFVDSQHYKTENFSISLSKNWIATAREKAHYFSLGKPGRTELIITEESNTTKEQLTQLILSELSKPFTQKVVNFGNSTGMEYFGCTGVEGCMDMYQIVIENGKGKLFYISFTPYPDQEKDLYKNTISTLKFN